MQLPYSPLGVGLGASADGTLEHLADAVVIPHLATLEQGTPWWVVTEAADLITGTQACPLWSAVTTQTRRLR